MSSRPRTSGFALSAGCRAPVEEVWKLLFDPSRFPQWWAGVETVRAGPPGEFTLWPTGYPDFPMPQKLEVDQAGERVTISDEGTRVEAEVVTRPFYDPDGEVLRS